MNVIVSHISFTLLEFSFHIVSLSVFFHVKTTSSFFFLLMHIHKNCLIQMEPVENNPAVLDGR